MRAPAPSKFLTVLTLTAALLATRAAWCASSGWTPQVSGTATTLSDIALIDATHGVAVGNSGRILHTVDGGAHWTTRVSGVSDGLLAVSFGDASRGIAAGQSGTLLTTGDGGATWTVRRNGWIDALHGVHMLNASLAWAVGVNGIFQPFVAKTTDGGATWNFSAFYIDGNEGTLRDVHFLDANVGIAVGNLWDGRGAIVRSTNGGSTWSRILLTSQPLLSVDFADAVTGVAVGTGGAILRTVNGGLSWSSQLSGTSAALAGVSLPLPGVGYAVGDGGTILKTGDGMTWTPQTSGVTNGLEAVSFVDADVGSAAGTSGVILRTDSGGEVRTSVPAAPIAGVLFSAAPNPFQGTTTFELALPRDGDVRIEIIAVTGRLVRALDAGRLARGAHRIPWDAADDGGRRVPPGLYLARCLVNGAPLGVTRLVLPGD